jgi:hypothetical protein
LEKELNFFFKKQQGILQQNILFKNIFRKMAKIRHKTKSLNKSPPGPSFFFSPQKRNQWPLPLFWSPNSEKCRPQKKRHWLLSEVQGSNPEVYTAHCQCNAALIAPSLSLSLSRLSLVCRVLLATRWSLLC